MTCHEFDAVCDNFFNSTAAERTASAAHAMSCPACWRMVGERAEAEEKANGPMTTEDDLRTSLEALKMAAADLSDPEAIRR